jgi:putative hemolysin
MFARFEKVPSVGEGFDWEGYRFEIVDMDGAKIDKALVYQVQSNPPNPA